MGGKDESKLVLLESSKWKTRGEHRLDGYEEVYLIAIVCCISAKGKKSGPAEIDLSALIHQYLPI